MDWFERLTGFREDDYESTRRKLEIDGPVLRSRVNGKAYGIGELEVVSLAELRRRASSDKRVRGRLRVRNVTGNVRRLHAQRRYEGALFQVASQFNLLEMMTPSHTPEMGVGIYEQDMTQGPACAIAAGAATIYRNYFALVDGIAGQTGNRQIDGLEAIGLALGQALGTSAGELWSMRNGYALCTGAGLSRIDRHLGSIGERGRDDLRKMLRIGLHRDVQSTEVEGEFLQTVSQAFCSALPVAYAGRNIGPWARFATLILEAAYEATIWSAVLNASRGISNTVLLTSLGGGAFGNDAVWIEAGLKRALLLASDLDLDVQLVSYAEPSPWMLTLERDFG